MEKKAASIIGIILGIAIIIVGFCVQGISIERYSSSIGSDIKFGADFYTEIYDVTRDVGYAVNNAKNTIVDAIESVCDAIGWLIVAIGLVDVGYFIYKRASCEGSYSGISYRPAPPAMVSTYTTQNQATHTYSPAPSIIVPEAKEDEWKCTCGKIHKKYETSCVCGTTRVEVMLPREMSDAGNAVEFAKSKQEKLLAETLEYALCYTTDDGMIQYLKRINDAVVAEILKAPAHQIRGLVEKTLQELK